MNWHILCYHSDRCFNYTVITNKLIAIRVIYFHVLSRKGYKMPQELQGPKYMPRLSVAGIRISLLFEENAIYCPGTIHSFIPLSSFEAFNVQAIWIESSRAFSFVFISWMSNPRENCCVQQSVAPPFFIESPKVSNRHGGIAITYTCPQENQKQT